MKKKSFNVGITLSHNLLGMATMELIKLALFLNGYFLCFLDVFLSYVLTKRRIWDIFDQSEAILSGSNKQILLTQ